MKNPTVLPSEHSGPMTACVWYTGLYIARAFDPSVPATKAEMLALAALGGCPNGESGNYTKLYSAMKSRYGLVGVVTDHKGALAAEQAVSSAVRWAVTAGEPIAVGLAGDGFNLTPRYQSNHFGHSIAVLYLNGAPGIQLDPLAPAGYMGDPFDGPELTKYATAAIVFRMPHPVPPAPPPPAAPKLYSQDELSASVAQAVAVSDALVAAERDRVRRIKAEVAALAAAVADL